MKAIRLKVADMYNPIGIDVVRPRFTWNCQGGIKQSAFRIVVSSEDGISLYDTGKVKCSYMNCDYDGEQLTSGMRCVWSVCLWDENDSEEWSDKAYFEMGLLQPIDWKAKWIHGRDTAQNKHLPADYYQKEVPLKGAVKSARLYATALGVYTVQINGARVSSVLAPGSTEYDKTLYYQTYDVTSELQNIRTCKLSFTVADGWYKGKLGADQVEYLFGNQTKLLAQLVIEYESGEKEIIGTDSSFQWCNDGPVRFADLKDGEVYDARMRPTYSEDAVEDTDEKRIPVASNAPLIKTHESFEAKLEISPSGQTILNFGQNMAGIIRFSTNAPQGTEIRIRMFEAKDHEEYSNKSLSFPDGNVDPVKQEILYIASGESEEYCPSFFYAGFQYALVEGLEEVNPENFKAVAIYSDIEYSGIFSCSNNKINQFFNNTVWSMKSNFVDVPTDCPQREKSGWTGDAQVFCKTATYLADTKAFFGKWLKDVRDCQRDNGMVVDVNPRVMPVGTERDIVNGSSGWADAAVIIPYTLWKATGDKTVIIDNYDLMSGWKNYIIDLCKDKSIFSLPEDHPMYPLKAIYDMFKIADSSWNQYIPEAGFHWGEWSVPQSEEPSQLRPDIALMSPKQEVTCAYVHYSMSLLAEMLEELGKEDEADVCREYANGSKEAYHVHWIKDGTIDTKHMAELVRPLALGLVDEKERQRIAYKLYEMVKARNYKVGTGFLSTPFLLQVLAENGYLDSAYRMLENEEAPGWLAMVKKGATTVWESYICYDDNDNPLPQSFNHYSLGAVCGFLFETVCGIQIAGENEYVISPQPGGSLSHAKACTRTAYGEVTSEWKKEKSQISYCICIPSNTVATVKLPGGHMEKVGPGKHLFSEEM